MIRQKKLAAGSNSSVVVERCQVCDSADLESIIFIGYLPPVNTMPTIASRPAEQPAYPAEVLRCKQCQLVQIGLIVDPAILFPPTYPYTSGTTKILRENFAELAQEVSQLYPLKSDDLVVDVGSNDGTLLSNFQRTCRVYGIEPTNAGKLALEKGINTQISFFNRAAVKNAVSSQGKAKIISATNVFAHIEDIHEIVDCILEFLREDGIFISESHYLLPLIETTAIRHNLSRTPPILFGDGAEVLLEMHGMEIINTRRIPTHGGSNPCLCGSEGKVSGA